MTFGSQVIYYVVDLGIVFLLGFVVGIVIRRALVYLIALIMSISLAVMYFQWRNVLHVSFNTIGSSISISTTQYSSILLSVFIIGVIAGILLSGSKKKKEKNKE